MEHIITPQCSSLRGESFEVELRIRTLKFTLRNKERLPPFINTQLAWKDCDLIRSNSRIPDLPYITEDGKELVMAPQIFL